MEINNNEAFTILEMAGYCYSEGELSEKACNLAKRVLLEWPGEKMASESGHTIFFVEGEGKVLYTDYLLKGREE